MKSIAVAAFLWIATSAAPRADWQLDWKRFDIDAHLDNSGAVHVVERTSVELAGGMSVLERKLAPGVDQRIEFTRFVRNDGETERDLTAGDDRNMDQYQIHDGKLSWRIKPDDAPDWDHQTLEFRLEYDLRNAIAPVWDIPAGPIRLDRIWTYPDYWTRWRQTIAAWRDAAHGFHRRYRFDHDITFPEFPAEGPRELHYTLRHDDAWQDPTPDAPFGRATPESDYRVTILRDYLRPGWPPAIELWRPAVRVGAILVSTLGALLLWLIYAIGEIRERGFITPRTNREWFAEHIASQRPEVLAWIAGVSGAPNGFAQFLARLRTAGVLSIRSEPDPTDEDASKIHLRLTGNESKLRPYEQAVLKELFPVGRETDTAQHEAAHAEDGFNPGEILEDTVADEFEDQQPVQRPAPLLWRLMRFLGPLLFLGGIALGILDIFLTGNIELLLAGVLIVPGLVIFVVVAKLIPKPDGGGPTALIVLGLVLLLLAGQLSLQFLTVLPLGPAASAGVAALTLWWVAALLAIVRSDTTILPVHHIVMRGKRYLRRELRRANPALDDAWIPQILALGGARDLENWRQRRQAALSGPLSTPMLPGVAPQLGNLHPFTGVVPIIPEYEWAEDLRVLSAEDLRELAEDEKEDAESEDEGTDDNERGD
ncbi:MAG: hypothetical protein ABI680_12430 [Chthoniobacteraceae bacterium]